jgi:diguanylate cyclase
METLLVQLADSVSHARTLEELTRPLLEMLHAVTGLESTYLTTIDLDRGLQHVLFASNSQQLQIPEGITAAWDDTLCKRALEEGRPFTDDVAERWGDSQAAKALGINTYISSAVRTGDGELYGTLCAASGAKMPMTANSERVLQLFSTLIGQHVERESLMHQLRKANAELSSHALTDALTGLPNRRALNQELSRMLARAQREGTSLHVGFIDLDGFKAINDVHGHEIGDRFLAAMAAKLGAGVRSGDLLARLGGDEFVVVAPESYTNHSADLLREHLARITEAHFQFDEVKIDYAGASVGLVTVEPGERSADAVLAMADAAMYEVKRARRQSSAA